MMQLRRTLVATLLVAFLGIGALMPFTARASEAGRRNTTLGLGALTGVLLYKKQWLPAAAAGVGTYYAYHNWQAQINARHRAENQLHYSRSYSNGYRRGVAYGRRVHRTRVVHHRRR